MAYFLTLAWLTLTPSTDSTRAYSLLGHVADIFRLSDGTGWVTNRLAEFVANVVLFVPMGLLLVLLFDRRRWWGTIIVGLLASCWIELAQGVWLGDRIPDSRDIVANTIGTALGVMLALIITWSAAQRNRRHAEARSARHAGA